MLSNRFSKLAALGLLSAVMMAEEAQAATAGVSLVDLNMSLDDIEDLPGFSVFPSGAYRVTLEEGLVQKKIGEHPAIEMAMKLEEVLEITEVVKDESEMPKVGDVCSTAYMLDNKTGAGALKETLLPIGEKLGLKAVGDILNNSKGLQLMVIIKRTYDEKKDRHYANVKKVSVL